MNLATVIRSEEKWLLPTYIFALHLAGLMRSELRGGFESKKTVIFFEKPSLRTRLAYAIHDVPGDTRRRIEFIREEAHAHA
jgi:hypothetical protein